MTQSELKSIITKELIQDKTTALMVKNKTQVILDCIDIAFKYTTETQVYKLYTICKNTIYLVSTFCLNVENKEENAIVANYLALNDDNKVLQGIQVSYKNNFLKDYLKCSNTILCIADTKYITDTYDKKFYEACKKKLNELLSISKDAIQSDDSQFLDKDFWINTLTKINNQLLAELQYIEDKTLVPSIRMQANQGISKAKYSGIQALLECNQTYKLNELV